MSNTPIRPSTYLKYLPALYGLPRKEGGEPPFIAAYLKIFEKLLSGIPEPAEKSLRPWAWPPAYQMRKGIRELLEPEVIGTLFHPRLSFLFADDPSVAETFTPPLSLGSARPTGDNVDKLKLLESYIGAGGFESIKAWLSAFLDWTGRTVALNVDQGWEIDTKRFVIAQALPLFRARGTIDGMTWLLNAWFGLDNDAPIRLVPDWPLKVVRISVSNPGFQPMEVCDSPQPGAFQLQDSREESTARLSDIVCFEDDPETGAERAVGYRAWYFVVTIHVVTARYPPDVDTPVLNRFKKAVEGVVNEFKPALTDYEIEVQVEVDVMGPPPPTPPEARQMAFGEKRAAHADND